MPLSENAWRGPASTRSRDEPERLASEQDLSRLRGLLEPRRDVDGVAGRDGLLRRRIADDHLAGVDPDPLLEAQAESLLEPVVQQLERAAHLVGGPDGAQRVVLVDERHAEDGHDRVADELLHGAAVPLEHRPHLVEVADHHAPHRLGIHALAEAREARDVAEQDGHRLAEERLRHRRHALRV